MSSRSSVYSDSSRVYTPDMLLQLGSILSSAQTDLALGSSASSTRPSSGAFTPEVLSAALEHFPDISNADAVHEQDTLEEEEDGFVYGHCDIRPDLDPLLVDQLSEAVHTALSNSYADTQITEILEPVVMEPKPRPRPFTYAKRTEALFGDRRPANPRSSWTPSRPVPAHGGAFNQRAQSYAYTRGNPRPPISKADTVTSWRRLDDGLKYSWNDATGGYVVVAA
ncbi:hypothetical protein PIIN_08834 [Serendipita indica DSM 11827]|uniref:Uncharacterized protein n=1 Tax=Serendipita indica (strain DSM 11827) TaxID=1109443 RepID=G4TU71_SERID|nr:hypothetical protein PIIN_08834 [Serendipita indica DSM 11827]